MVRDIERTLPSHSVRPATAAGGRRQRWQPTARPLRPKAEPAGGTGEAASSDEGHSADQDDRRGQHLDLVG